MSHFPNSKYFKLLFSHPLLNSHVSDAFLTIMHTKGISQIRVPICLGYITDKSWKMESFLLLGQLTEYNP